VDSFTISTMPKDDATEDVITDYSLPAEMTGTGEITNGTVHIHAPRHGARRLAVSCAALCEYLINGMAVAMCKTSRADVNRPEAMHRWKARDDAQARVGAPGCAGEVFADAVVWALVA
jgi:hypothetical protein